MEFTFFDAADTVLFVRSDAERASWTVEEMSLSASFPYDPARVITRGMRIGFTDPEGVFQVFEIRKAKTQEPDHYQEITAEHIVISELTDEVFEKADWTNVTAAAALGQLLTGTLWSVGTSTASNTSSGSASTGSVWQNVRTIEDNWNVYLSPRATVGPNGITGRYIDIRPYGGTWNGIRLSLDKNADQIGVTWDDTKVKTALYGYGAAKAGSGNEKEPLTFAEIAWAATQDHPAKPQGQTYLEDPAATAAYGRNGRPRYGYYQNGDIEDAETLLEKTWEVLKTVNVPEVSVECSVHDLYRLGYADQPIRLHDSAIVEIRPTGVNLQREITRLTVDLLDPTATRVTIGAYIPNIVYINEAANRAANGGGGSGSRAQGAQTQKEYETFFRMNDFAIDLQAVQYVAAGSAEILRQAGMSINAQGVIVYADDNANMLQSKLNVQADRISLVVEGTGANAHIKAAQITAAINGQTGQSIVKLSADVIDIDGLVTALEAKNIGVGGLHVEGAAEFLQTIYAEDYIHTDESLSAGTTVTAGTGFMVTGSNDTATWQSTSVVTGVTVGAAHDYVYHDQYGQEQLANGKLVTAVTANTLHYLGSTPT